MKKRQTKLTPSSPLLSTTITALSHDGRGVASSATHKTTFISGTLPGEIVTFHLTKKHARYNEGQVVDISNPSVDRITPECPHFNVCGGCSMQHVQMDTQIAEKQKILLEQLKHFGHVAPEELMQPISANAWGYRRKARLGVRYVVKQEKVYVGFREKASNVLTDIETCLVLHPSAGKYIPQLSRLIMSLSLYTTIPQIDIAVGDKSSVLVIRHLQPLNADDLHKLTDFGKNSQLEIYLQPNPPEKISKLWPQDDIHYLSYALPDYALEMRFHPLDFIQVNNEINQLMVKQALNLLAPEPNDTVLDLFCGLGNFTLPIARAAKSVVGIEGSQEMVTRAQSNALHNKISNTEFYAANLAAIPSAPPAWMQQKYDKILLDPPRTGAKEIIPFFPKFAPKRIVYVSCNPATLARDAGELVHNQGYKLKKVGIINMFPHTSHIEAIALFVK
jgi:23S rRNA (uracil1939-C5)-methyltransferase